MHGNPYGIGAGDLTGEWGFFTWPWVAEWINDSNYTHFVFANCYSGNLTFYTNFTYRVFVPPYESENISDYKYTDKIYLSYNCTELLYEGDSSKTIYAFAGEVDYEVIVIYSAEEINRIVREMGADPCSFHKEAKKRHELANSLITLFKLCQLLSNLFYLLFIP